VPITTDRVLQSQTENQLSQDVAQHQESHIDELPGPTITQPQGVHVHCHCPSGAAEHPSELPSVSGLAVAAAIVIGAAASLGVATAMNRHGLDASVAEDSLAKPVQAEDPQAVVCTTCHKRIGRNKCLECQICRLQFHEDVQCSATIFRSRTDKSCYCCPNCQENK